MGPNPTMEIPDTSMLDNPEKLGPKAAARRNFRIALQHLLPLADGSGDENLIAAADCAMQGMRLLSEKTVLD